jgi:hypothetical protein
LSSRFLIACPPAPSWLQARNKPIEPPKKPAAAPFFLPTLAGADAGRNPVFDFEAGAAEAAAAAAGPAAADAALAAKAAAAWGEGDDEDAEQGAEGRPQNGAADAAASSDSEGEAPAAAARARRQPGGRVLHTHAQAHHSPLVRLLRSCSRAGDWASLVAHLRQLSPVAVDSEIRGMQVLEGAPEQELEDLGLLLQFLEEETASNRNFEFMQASLSRSRESWDAGCTAVVLRCAVLLCCIRDCLASHGCCLARTPFPPVLPPQLTSCCFPTAPPPVCRRCSRCLCRCTATRLQSTRSWRSVHSARSSGWPPPGAA